MADPIRVVSVPATHVYVRRLEHPQVVRLDDPSGDDLRTPSFLSPEWVAENAATFDVFHVHFGMEFYDPSRIAAVADVLDAAAVPLVYTCHDLRNPNHLTSNLHDAHLDVLVPRAAEVVTLTTCAADVLRARYGRKVTVLPHPHVVPAGTLRWRQARPRPGHEGYLVGVHFKSMRPNMCGPSLLRPALEAARGEAALRVRVDVHHDVVDPSSPRYDAELSDLVWSAAADRGAVLDLHVHHYLSDDELWDYLESIDAFVLPYTFGTHSGLLEACKDLGTSVIAPDCGGYAEQGAQHLFHVTEGGIDADSLQRAMVGASRRPPPEPIPVGERLEERREIAGGYVAVYRRAVAAVGR